MQLMRQSFVQRSDNQSNLHPIYLIKLIKTNELSSAIHKTKQNSSKTSNFFPLTGYLWIIKITEPWIYISVTVVESVRRNLFRVLLTSCKAYFLIARRVCDTSPSSFRGVFSSRKFLGYELVRRR